MTAAPIFMLRTCDAQGTVDQFLPDFESIDMSPVYCDSGTIQFSYPSHGVNFNLLAEDTEIAVMMNGVEIPELRSVVETVEGDDADDQEEGALWKFTCRTMVGKLETAVIYPVNFAVGQVLTKVTPPTFGQKTPGYILNYLFQVAKNRGALANFTWDFNASVDSEGNTWNNQIDYNPDIGKDYLSVLKELHDQGFIEFQVEGRLIRVWDTDQMGVDRSFGPNPLIFRKGRDLKDSPRKVDTRNLRSAILVSGADNTVYLELKDNAAISKYGRRETLWSAGSTPYKKVGTSSTLEMAGQGYLNSVDKPALELTHGLHFETEDNPRPIRDFNIGDWALTDVGRGVERFRILQWVMSVSQAGECSGSITMNFMFNTQLSQVAGSLSSITNGTTNAGSAPKNDQMPPAQVGAPVLSSAVYFVNGVPRSTLTVSWPEVTTNDDGSDIFDLDYYEISWKYSSDTNWRATSRVEAEDNQLAVQFVNLDPGASVQVRVRASDYWNNHSSWSSQSMTTLAGDTIAPNKPSSPTVTSNVGTLRVTWSGLDYQGNAMPADLAGVEVHVSTSDFTPSAATKKDVLPAGTLATTITGLTYGQEYWVKLIAFDTTGNKSDPSDTTSTSHAVLKQVVSTEIGTGQVGLNNTTFSDVGNLIDDGTFENADKRAARQTLIGTQHLAFDNGTSSNGVWCLRSDPWAGSSNESILLQGSLPVKPGERVFGAADYRQTSDVPSNSYLTLAIKWVSKLGDYIDSNGFVSDVFYTLSDNGFTAKDNAWHRRVTNVSQVAPSGAVYAEIWLIAQNRTTGTIWIDAVEVRKQIDTLMIAQAAITNAQIADLAVNNAKIADMSVGKLTAGELQADVLLGARIKTADTGPRVEVNSGGIGAWNADGVQTVAIAQADGSVNIIGALRSGTSGRRVEINPTNTFLPEIRFYPTSGNNYAFLNAVSSGSFASVGLNSGQFTWNGDTCEVRLYMTDTSSSFEAVRVVGQSKLGPTFTLFEDQARAGWFNSSGNEVGYMSAFNGGASIGSNGTTATQSGVTYASTGFIYTTGRYNNYITAANNDAIFTGTVSWTNSTGVIMSYGPTMLTTPIPIACGYYTGTSSPSFWVSARSVTGFTFASSISISAQAQFWCFRV